MQHPVVQCLQLNLAKIYYQASPTCIMPNLLLLVLCSNIIMECLSWYYLSLVIHQKCFGLGSVHTD